MLSFTHYLMVFIWRPVSHSHAHYCTYRILCLLQMRKFSESYTPIANGVNAKINAFEKHHESYARFLFVSHLTMCLHIINLLDAKTKPRTFNTHKRCNEWISYTEYLFFILFFSALYTRTVSMQYQRLYLIFNKSNWLVYFGILLSGCIDWMPRILK